MATQHDWLQVDLDQNSRRGLAEAVEANSDPGNDQRVVLLRMLRSSRDELLLDAAQGELVLDALNVGGQMSALRARLEAFLGRRCPPPSALRPGPASAAAPHTARSAARRTTPRGRSGARTAPSRSRPSRRGPS